MAPERAIRSIEEANKIPDLFVRVRALHLMTVEYPDRDVAVLYEPDFISTEWNGKVVSTKPDLKVYVDDNEEFYDESTISNPKPYLRNTHLPWQVQDEDHTASAPMGFAVIQERDPKIRQKKIMEAALPEVGYKVNYGRDLREIIDQLDEKLIPTQLYRQLPMPPFSQEPVNIRSLIKRKRGRITESDPIPLIPSEQLVLL